MTVLNLLTTTNASKLTDLFTQMSLTLSTTGACKSNFS